MQQEVENNLPLFRNLILNYTHVVQYRVVLIKLKLLDLPSLRQSEKCAFFQVNGPYLLKHLRWLKMALGGVRSVKKTHRSHNNMVYISAVYC